MPSRHAILELPSAVVRLAAWSFLALALCTCVERRVADFDILTHRPGLERDCVDADELMVRLVAAATATAPTAPAPGGSCTFVSAAPRLAHHATALDPYESRGPPVDTLLAG
jgi:hypothetical protein